MACFLVSAAEAAVITAVEKVVEKKEMAVTAEENDFAEQETRIPLSRKLRWLSNMLWGGVVLLMFEHIWHGEVVPWFPFLTAMSDPSEAAAMFGEMATAGVCMALLISAVWFIMCKAADSIVSRKAAETEAQ